MREVSLHTIHRIRRVWVRTRLLSLALYACAIAMPAVAVLAAFTGQAYWPSIVFFTAALLALLARDKSWRATDRDVAGLLNERYPELQESAELLLKTSHDNLLETLQVERTANALQQIRRPSLPNRWLAPLLFALGSLVVSVALFVFLHSSVVNQNRSDRTEQSAHDTPLPTGMESAMVKIVPPSYTGKPSRSQTSLNLEVEAGAEVVWKFRLSRPAKIVRFVYNDSLTVLLKSNEAHDSWEAVQTLNHAGFYQVQIDSVVSELYRIEVKPDQPPVISVTSPKLNTVIEYGEPEKINVVAHVSDDYGIRNAIIQATVAKGSGEAVSFKTQELSFGVSFAASSPQYDLQKPIALRSLGMEPGDELYFYLTATDNHGQEKRSDIYIVTITDTAKLMSLDGLLNGVNLKPDYFRSQRQIILDAEQLLRDKDTALLENFNNRSNNLGVDQKLLRLRYGKFLGEESSSNEDVSGDALGDPANFGNAESILDAFTDKHDNAEDATFLDPETKKQLKAVLTEMWSAELQLRLFKPKEALPFAYKALRLLKDLQQKSRAYVAKTSVKTPPIKMEKRLTGKLDKIIEPNTHATLTPAADKMEELRNALSILERLKKNQLVNERDRQVLRLASAQLNERAVKEPSVFLAAFESMKKLFAALSSGKTTGDNEIVIVQRALQKMASTPEQRPSRTGRTGGGLQDAYFRNLQKNKNG